MVNLPGFGSVRNFAKAISTGANINNNALRDHDESSSSEQRKGGGASVGPCLRNAPSAAESDSNNNNNNNFATAEVMRGHHSLEDHAEDPLIYRLQHQQRYLKEKQDRRSGKFRKSPSSRRSSQRDPFDVGGSFTSEEASLIERNSNSINKGNNSSSVDVVGWGSGCDSDFDLSGRSNSFRRKEGSYIFSDFGDDHEEEEKSVELYVDFGGVTPVKTEDGKSQRIHCSSDGVDVDARLPISPTLQFSAQKIAASSQHMHRLQHHRHEMERRHSSSSSSNNSYIPGNNEGSHERYSPPLHRPSHQDLSHILSSLEKEAEEAPPLAAAPQPVPTPAPQPRRFGGASSCCDSTLSSPTSKRRRSISISSCSASPENDQQCVSSSSGAVSLHAPLPFPHETPQRCRPKEQPSPPMPQSSPTKQLSSPATPSQPQPQTQTQPQSQLQPQTQPHRKSPQEEEEDDPRLAQLRQQTTDELRTELYKMQAQSKSNLEDSWAETERLRVEISQLEEDLEDAKKQLVELRDNSNAAVSSSANQGVGGWQQGTPSVHSENSDGHRNSRISPSPQRKGIRGSFSVMSLADLVQETKLNSPFPTNTWEVKTTTTKLNWKASVGKSFRNNRNYSIGAANALMGNATTDDIGETANISSSKSCSGKPNNRSILADLGKGFRSGAKSSADGSSAAGSDFDFGTGIGIDESTRSARMTPFNTFDGIRGKREFDKNDPSSSSHNGKDADDHPSSGENDACNGDDDSIDLMGGVFYPPPSENEAKEEDITQNSHSSWSSMLESSVACSEMDDFDFDPLSEMPTPAANAANSSKSVSGRTNERNLFARRPSLSSLFEGKYRSDGDDEDSSSSSDSSSNNNPPRRKEDRAPVAKSSILEKDNEINQLTEKIRVQADDILNCEADILISNTKCGEDENQCKSKESILQKEIGELEQKDSDTASKLEHFDGSKRNEQERENDLKEKLANLSEDECEDDLEHQLSLYQEQYNTSQENAISSLSGLLNDFEAMCIPSLRGELEDNVCGDIIARFDDLTDKEEELVKVLSDTDRLTSCHASFQQIQKHIETAMNWQNQLGQLETDLHSYLVTITMLIKQDDEGTHTTESSTASERSSLERVFVEAIILHLGSVKQNQGKLILDALFKSVEFLTKWDEWLLPDFATSSPPPARLSSDELVTGVSTIAMLECVVGEASAELAAVKTDVLNEQAKFQAKMQSAGLSYPRPNSNAMFTDRCNVNNTTGGFGTNHDDTDERLTKESAVKKLNKQITQQISTAESIISERESFVDKFASSFHPMSRQERNSQVYLQLQDEFFEEDGTEISHELEEVVKEISTATKSLSEKEFLRKKYSTELDSMQTQASRDSKTNLQTLDEIQSKIKLILAKLANEESLIASLKSLLRSKKENVSSRSITSNR